MAIPNAGGSASIMHRLLLFLAAVLAILGAAGCASVSPAPFATFATSIQRLREGADGSLSVVYGHTRNRYVAEATAGDIARIDVLLLIQPAGDPFGWVSPDPPLFLKVARFREGVHRLNSVLVSYAGLLRQLASPGLVGSEKFERLANDLNDSLRAAVRVLAIPAPPDKEIAVFSTLGTAAFQAYLKNRRRESLIKALDSNQSAIQEAAELGASAVRIAAMALRNEYNHNSAKLAALIANPTLSAPGKQAALRGLIGIDEKFIKEVSVLRTLHQSYVALPAAHRELATEVADPKRGLPMVLELLENARGLDRLRDELSKDD
jgi:hypothetical protein